LVDEVQNETSIGSKVFKVLLNNLVNCGIIHIPIQMYHAITEANHLAEYRHKFMRENALFIKYDEGVIAILGRPITFVGYNVMSNIQTTFNRHLQQMLGAFYFSEILKKFFFGIAA